MRTIRERFDKSQQRLQPAARLDFGHDSRPDDDAIRTPAMPPLCGRFTQTTILYALALDARSGQHRPLASAEP